MPPKTAGKGKMILAVSSAEDVAPKKKEARRIPKEEEAGKHKANTSVVVTPNTMETMVFE